MSLKLDVNGFLYYDFFFFSLEWFVKIMTCAIGYLEYAQMYI